MTVPESNEELLELCRYWQRQLRLQDWEVRIRFVKRHEMQDVTAWGQSDPHLDSRTAEILVLRPDEFANAERGKSEIEDTVVHELLHLHLEPLTNSPENKKAVELPINLLAAALVRLNKGERR